MNFKLNPTKQLVLLLGTLTVLGTAFNFSGQILLHLVATLGWALILYWAYSNFSTERRDPWNTVITALIIFLILHYGVGLTDLVFPLVATFIAITWKFFISYKGSPVINPAAGALLLTAALVPLILNVEPPNISWWGASFRAPLTIILLGLWVVLGVPKWRKHYLLITFLLAHLLILIFRGSEWETIRFIFTDSTIYFFAGVMLIEPKTSPLKVQKQVFYGLFAAMAYNVFFQYNLPYAELFTLVAANLVNVLLMPRLKKKT